MNKLELVLGRTPKLGLTEGQGVGGAKRGGRGAGRALLALAVVGVLGAAGCAVGPNYKAPDTTMPASWPATAPAAEGPAPATQVGAKTLAATYVTSGAAHLAGWWSSFHDPILDSLIVRSLKQNLSLQSALAAVRQARYQLNSTAANLGPFVTGNASYNHSRSSNNLSKEGGTKSEGDLFQSGFDATWQLDIFGGIRRSVEQYKALLQAAEDNRRAVMVTLVSEVASDYITLRGVQSQIAVADRNIVLQRQTVKLTQQQMQAGFNTGLDLANAQAQLATTESQLPPLKTQEQQLIYALGILLGQAPDSVASELIVPHPIPPTPPSVPIGLPGDLLLNRPDVRAAERQLAAATAGIGVAEADLYPKFVINGNIGFSAVDAAKWFDANSLTWGIGPSVSWNILSSGQVQSNINAQKAVRDQDFYTYKETVLQALDDVDSALAAYNQEHAHRRALMAAVADNERAVALSTKLYRNGLTSFLNVLQAQGALYATQNSLVQSNLALSTDLVALYKAIGGGWQVGKTMAK